MKDSGGLFERLWQKNKRFLEMEVQKDVKKAIAEVRNLA
jgi:hypothetical protein